VRRRGIRKHYLRRRYGAKSALDYLLGEKLLGFSEEAKQRPAFAQELPRFLAAIWQVFNPYEIAGYVACQKPRTRKALRSLLYLRTHKEETLGPVFDP
jgi:hypothetical protein